MVRDPLQFATEIAIRLDEAGLALARLRLSGPTTALRTFWPEPVRQIFHDEIPDETVVQIVRPTARQIDEMDEAFRWLGLLPTPPSHLRAVVLRRLVFNARSERPRYTWRRLGKDMGVSHHTVKRWHGDAVALIARKLSEPQLFASHTSHFSALRAS